MDDYKWQYTTDESLDKTFLERLECFPRKPDIFIYLLRCFFASILRFCLKIYHGLNIIGKENIPSEESYILVANHSSHLDALCLSSIVPFKKIHKVFPVAAKDYFFTNVTRTFFSAVFINALPFGRYSNTKQSLQICDVVLSNKGNALIIFPEGTRSRSGEIGRFKPGIGFLLAGSRIPCVPCYIEGAYGAWPKGRYFPFPGKVKIHIGQSLFFDKYSKGTDVARNISEKIKEAVEKLRQVSE